MLANNNAPGESGTVRSGEELYSFKKGNAGVQGGFGTIAAGSTLILVAQIMMLIFGILEIKRVPNNNVVLLSPQNQNVRAVY